MKGSDDPLAGFRAWIEQLVRDEVRKALGGDPGAFMSTSEAADFARVSADTLRRWTKIGRLYAYKAGRELRFKRADLEAALTPEARRSSRSRSNPENLSPEEHARRDFARFHTRRR